MSDRVKLLKRSRNFCAPARTPRRSDTHACRFRRLFPCRCILNRRRSFDRRSPPWYQKPHPEKEPPGYTSGPRRDYPYPTIGVGRPGCRRRRRSQICHRNHRRYLQNPGIQWSSRGYRRLPYLQVRQNRTDHRSAVSDRPPGPHRPRWPP